MMNETGGDIENVGDLPHDPSLVVVVVDDHRHLSQVRGICGNRSGTEQAV